MTIVCDNVDRHAARRGTVTVATFYTIVPSDDEWFQVSQIGVWRRIDGLKTKQLGRNLNLDELVKPIRCRLCDDSIDASTEAARRRIGSALSYFANTGVSQVQLCTLREVVSSAG